MSRLLYVDAVGGVAGDMLLGALIDAGADVESIRAGLASLGVDGLELELSTAQRHGIGARRVTVVAREEPPVHRTWADVRRLLDAATLPERALRRAHLVFAALARAEGRVHAIDPEEVHFHEVGAIDAIADVCGIALALESLDVGELVSSPLPMPRGLIGAAHGTLPLPAPATVELLRGMAVHGVDLDVELVTPTGAAVIAALAGDCGAMPAMRLDAVGYGAGAREIASRPNVVRVVVGQRTGPSIDRRFGDELALVEANLDDLPAQLIPDVAERCFAAGAVDVWVTPAVMKKGRPGAVLSALARPGDERAVAETILRETTTLGVRLSVVRRWELERDRRVVEVAGHPIHVKQGYLDGETVNAWPEYDDCRRVAQETGRPVKAIWMAAVAAAAEGGPR